ncbi:hypothetical protein IKE67_09880 [bacterium]|nr:hypothetical protein [bacterium]
MKKLFISVFLYVFFNGFSSCFAQDEVYLAIEDTQPKFLEEVRIEQPEINPNLNEGENFVPELYEKTDVTPQPMAAEVEYDILYETKGLLSKYKNFKFEHGPIERMEPIFAYQGQMNFNFLDTKYSTKFIEPTLDFGFIGKFSEQPIEYRFLVNFVPLEGQSYLQSMFKDDFIILKYIPHNDITIGSFRTPIGVEGGTSGYTIPFIARSQLSRNFGSVRGVGVKVSGDYDLFEYNLSLTSSGRNWKNMFRGTEFTGWVNAKPLGKTDGKYGVLKVGGGLNAGHREFDYNVIGAYLSYKYKKFAIECEYAASHGSNGLTGLTRNNGQGFYTTLSYNITKNLQLLARYDVFNSDTSKSHHRDTEYTAGLNYYIKGSALKFMLNYVFCQSDYKPNSNRIIFGTQIIL